MHKHIFLGIITATRKTRQTLAKTQSTGVPMHLPIDKPISTFNVKPFNGAGNLAGWKDKKNILEKLVRIF